MAYCYDSFGRAYYCYSSSWYDWGRWVLLGVLILAFFLTFFLFSCISARRRRRAGLKPMYGTGWAGGQHGQAAYNPGYNQQAAQQYNYSQPQGGYDASHNQGYYNQNQGYYGGQQSGIEMPSSTYQPPAGPPPGKH